MALDEAALRTRVWELLGTCEEQLSTAQVDRAIARALISYSRYQVKKEDVSLAVSAGVDTYDPPSAALGIVAHSYGASWDRMPVITGFENYDINDAGDLGDLGQASLAMDLLLDRYEEDMLRSTQPVHTVRLEGGKLVLFPAPESDMTVHVRLKGVWTVTDFPFTDQLDALEALEYESAYYAGQVLYAIKSSVASFSVGPKSIQLADAKNLKELYEEYHALFLALVGSFTVARQ